MFLKARLGAGQQWGVGVRPGPAGYIVLDVDVKGGGTGLEDLARLTDELGPLPKAMAVDTASGLHYWLLRPDKPEQIGNVNLAPGIEIRCDSGYVVAPGTTSLWGSWTRDPSTAELTDVGQLPDGWAEKLYPHTADGSREPIPERLTTGARHKTYSVWQERCGTRVPTKKKSSQPCEL